MKETKTKSVNMNFAALYSYIINTHYRSVSGLLGLALSVGAAIILVAGWEHMTVNQRVIYFLVACAFTIINPGMLAFKTLQQLKLSPSYKKPLDYSFGDEGITVSQGELNQEIKWNDIYRIMLTKSMLAIYTGKMHAFVIPVAELGKDKAKILTTVVQYTTAYKVRISKNLREYQSGKGI